MTDWKKVTGTQPERPEEIDRTSSPSTVYLRKNIEQVEKEVEGADGEKMTVTEWQYDEKEMTVEEQIQRRQGRRPDGDRVAGYKLV